MIYYLLEAIKIYSYLLMIYALLSWFPGAYQSGLGRLLAKICEPYLSLFDHLNLRIGPLDFTIWVAAIVLNLASQAIIIIVSKIALM